jgi:hypothetical protein
VTLLADRCSSNLYLDAVVVHGSHALCVECMAVSYAALSARDARGLAFTT